MTLKQNITLEQVKDKLSEKLSSHIDVRINNNPFNKNIRWISVKKNPFIAIKIFQNNSDLLVDTYIPNFFARAFFGGIISGIFLYSSRNEFKEKISSFLVSEFYDQ